jgi:sulfur carrier protein ThiS
MTATVRLGDSLKNMLGIEGLYTVEIGHNVFETIVSLGIKPELVAMVSVNDELQSKDYVIEEGDAIRLMAVIGGG